MSWARWQQKLNQADLAIRDGNARLAAAPPPITARFGKTGFNGLPAQRRAEYVAGANTAPPQKTRVDRGLQS
jgi:hypothetical protein